MRALLEPVPALFSSAPACSGALTKPDFGLRTGDTVGAGAVNLALIVAIASGEIPRFTRAASSAALNPPVVDAAASGAALVACLSPRNDFPTFCNPCPASSTPFGAAATTAPHGSRRRPASNAP